MSQDFMPYGIAAVLDAVFQDVQRIHPLMLDASKAFREVGQQVQLDAQPEIVRQFVDIARAAVTNATRHALPIDPEVTREEMAVQLLGRAYYELLHGPAIR